MQKYLTTNNLLGESPIWNHYKESLFWVDIDSNNIHRYDDHHERKYNLKNKPTSLGLMDTDTMFVTVDNGCGILDLRTGKYNSMYINPDTMLSDVRMNDGKCAKDGTYWVGSMDNQSKKKIGSLYKVDYDFNMDPVLDGLGIPNGLAFTHDNKKMYLADSLVGEMYLYDYNEGNPKKNRVMHTTDHRYGYKPDGATVDCYDTLYSALWGGSYINIFNNDKFIDEIEIDEKFPTSVCFGGKDMNILFATSAYDKNTKKGGNLHYKKMEIKGNKEPSVKLRYP